MSIFVQKGAPDCSISDDELRVLVHQTIEKSGKQPKKMLLLPPDHTRLNSRAGRITEMIYEDYHEQCEIDIKIGRASCRERVWTAV